MKKKMIAFVLSVALVFSCGGTAFAGESNDTVGDVSDTVMVALESEATIVVSGTCGTDLTWELDDEGTLTIDGSGSMSSYSEGTAPWYEYRSQIYSLVVESGATSVGQYAFYGCTSLIDIVIPESVEKISTHAFQNCTKLTSVAIASGVTELGVGVFYGCTSLMEVAIPDSVTTVGSYTFYGCTNLTAATLPESITIINVGLFYGCSSLASITIPDNVTSIDTNAFYGCSSLESIVLSEKLAAIGVDAFYECSSLTEITIPYSVSSIGSYAFGKCSGLTDVYYEGSKEDWQSIVIDSGNTYLTEARIHYATTMDISSCEVSQLDESYPYIGMAIEPDFVVMDGEDILEEGFDYTVSYSDNVNVGTATFVVTGTNNYTGSITESFIITRGEQEISIDSLSLSVLEGEMVEILASATEGTLSYVSSDTNVATVDDNGVVTGVSSGFAIITITAAETDNYETASEMIEITVEEDTRDWDTVCVGNSTSITISSSSDQTYTFTCADGAAVSAVLTGQSSSVITVGGVSRGTYSKTYRVTVTVIGKHVLNIVGSSGSSTEYYLEVLNHDYTETLVEATCKNKGYMKYTCTRCGDSYMGDAVSDALGHEYESEVTEPTCTEAGYTTYTCTRCGDSYIANEASALGHSWDEGVVAGNTITYTCIVCGETKTENVNASGGNNDDTNQNTEDNSGDTGSEDNSGDAGSEDTSDSDDTEDSSSSADTLLVRRGNWFYVNYTLKGGNADMSFTYGKDTDEVLIGDWDGDGIDTICVRRGNRFYFSNTLGGQADFYIDFGRTSDEVVVGDWDGDGCDTICVRRGNHYYINNTLESGNAEIDFTFGRVDDEVLAGDWDGDGYDTRCIRRGNHYYIDNTLEGGNAAIDFTFGRDGDEVYAGTWR